MTARTAPAIGEAEWQQQVIDLAHALGWKHLHVRRSIGKGRKWVTATNVPWPDLTLWSERQRRLIVAELKTDRGKATPGQEEVLWSLAAAGVECHVWRPADLDEVQRVLQGDRLPQSHRRALDKLTLPNGAT